MPDGPWTRKKLSLINKQRFTDENMAYTQVYMDYIWGINPFKLKFMDESAVQEGVAQRQYGSAPIGQRAYEITKVQQRNSDTINLLIGLTTKFCKVNPGPSDTNQYVNFMEEATNTYQNGEPVLNHGDLVIVDNCIIHHYEAELALTDYFSTKGIEYIFLPKYSPDLNPVEKCFNEIKMLFKQARYLPIMKRNVAVATYDAVEEISFKNIVNYFRATQCINI